MKYKRAINLYLRDELRYFCYHSIMMVKVTAYFYCKISFISIFRFYLCIIDRFYYNVIGVYPSLANILSWNSI